MTFFSIALALPYFIIPTALFTYVKRTNKAARAKGVNSLPLRGDKNWAYVFPVFGVVLFLWMLLWPYEGDVVTDLACAILLIPLCLLVLWRRAIVGRLRKHFPGRTRAHLHCALVILFAAVFCTIALEIPWNMDFPFVDLHALAIEYVLILLLLTAAYFLNLAHGIAPAVIIGHLCAVGVIQAFVINFKDAVLTVSDLFAFRTAMAVSGGYSYPLNSRILLSMLSASTGFALCLLIFDEPTCVCAQDTSAKLTPLHPLDTDKKERHTGHTGHTGHADPEGHQPHDIRQPYRRSSTIQCLLLGTSIAVLLIASIIVPDYQTDLGIEINYLPEEQLSMHMWQCFLPSFIAEAQDLPLDRPAGYSTSVAKAAEDDLIERYEYAIGDSSNARAAAAQWDEIQPSIVVIMNETFTDLRLFGDLNGYEGPTFFSEGLTDGLYHGKLAVSVNGGGTCNTEFEFLCGESMAFIGNGKYPYTLYDFSNVDSLPRQLSDVGYTSSAIHPNLKTNWDRERVYKELGFDEFYDIDDFKDADLYHNATSDEATYDKVVQILRESEGPQFIFDVTMQNHSGYSQGGIPQEELEKFATYGIDSLDDETNTSIREYLACIDESDRALSELIDELSTLDKPVVLVFFGDHQPYFTNVLNDIAYPDENVISHTERLYLSDYVIWSNYDVAGSATTSLDVPASASDLAARTLCAIGAPLTDHQKALLGATTMLSQLNLYGYSDFNGTWYTIDDIYGGIATKAVNELRYLSYRDFALRVRK